MFCDSKSERAELNAAPRINQDTNRIKDSWWEAPAVPLSNAPEHSVIYPLLNGIFLATPKKDCVGIHYFPSYCAPPFLSAAHVKAPPVYRLLKSSIQPHWWPPSTCRTLYCPSSHAPVLIQNWFASLLLYLLPARTLLPLGRKDFCAQAPCMSCNSTCLAFIQVVSLK